MGWSMSSEGVMTGTDIKRAHPLSFPIKMVWVAIAMIFTFHLAVTTLTKHYLLVIDGMDASERCIPEFSVYLLKRKYGQIEHGKIYTFKAKGMTPFYQDNMLITKYAVGLPGDEVIQNAKGVFINNERITDGYPLIDKLGVEQADLYKSYRLKDNEVFFIAPAERSFDSRYWGTADINEIVGEAIPLW
ncbi:hypothetical protein VAZ01S_023_00650 [Vibrio azureus NBRC 104587]|uniref:Peptidase S26 domain-containing protein n=2 Tax=Vibrio azureus TaxID=512649 RepID=U3CA93_9VIBR|nr:hypothetical protein VAZ01S_023_00650 [Vibrio azureus NBRC 104587]